MALDMVRSRQTGKLSLYQTGPTSDMPPPTRHPPWPAVHIMRPTAVTDMC